MAVRDSVRGRVLQRVFPLLLFAAMCFRSHMCFSADKVVSIDKGVSIPAPIVDNDQAIQLIESVGAYASVHDAHQSIGLILLGQRLKDARTVQDPELPYGSLIVDGGFASNLKSVDAFFRAVARCPNVSMLRLPIRGEVDAGMSHLAGHPGIREIHFNTDAFSLPSMEALATFPQIEAAYCSRGGDDDMLAPLGRCRHLRILEISLWKISGEGLAHLSGLKSLESLKLSSTSISGGLQHLSDLPLIDLGLQSTDINDEDLADVARISKLKKLNLLHTKVTDAGLAHIATMPALARLLISDAPITSAGLSHLRKLPRLDSLLLSDIDLDDEALGVIASLEGIRRLDICDTGVSREQVETLQKRLGSKCDISSDYDGE